MVSVPSLGVGEGEGGVDPGSASLFESHCNVLNSLSLNPHLNVAVPDIITSSLKLFFLCKSTLLRYLSRYQFQHHGVKDTWCPPELSSS